MAEGHNSLPGKMLTNDEIKNRVINIFKDFVSDVDPDQLSDLLIAKRIITIDRWNEIRAERTTQRKCRELVLYLLSITHPTAFLVVREALEKDCPHIWEKIENQPSRTTEEEAGLKFNARWKEEKEKLVKEMNEERLQWKTEKEDLENRNTELNQELLNWKTEKEDLENRNTELNQELLTWKTEKEYLENCNGELNQELLKWKTEKEDLENRNTELNQELLKWKTEKEDLENRNKELNQELLKWKTKKEDLETRITDLNKKLLKLITERDNLEKGTPTQATKQSGLKFNARWKEEKDKLVKEMNEERLQWKKEKEVLENRITEMNKKLLKWKTEKEKPEKLYQATKQSDSVKTKENISTVETETKKLASVNIRGKLNFPRGDMAQGLAKLNDSIYVLMSDVKSVFVFEDEMPFRIQKQISVNTCMIEWKNELTSSNKTKCLYVSDESNKCIWKIRTDDINQVTKWLANIDGLLPPVSVTTDGDFIILRKQQSVLFLEFYDATDAKLIRTLPLPIVIYAPLCCIQEPGGDFIISHRSKTEGVVFGPWIISRLTNNGEISCQFNPVKSSQNLNRPSRLCHDPIDNRLYVLDSDNRRIVLLNSKSLTWSQILLERDGNEIETPDAIFYDLKKRQLIVSQKYRRHVSVFSVC